MPKVSIIVPVYKVEQYIRNCLDSIQQQSFTDWECLLINDGSPDNSGIICEEYAAKDSRFKVFHKQNGGVSSARNFGMDKATGEWITFIDSDDFISSTFIEGLYAPIAKGEQLDFVHGGCTNWKDKEPAGINQEYDYYVGDEPEKLFQELRGLTISKLFLLENVRFWSNGLGLRFDEKMKIAEDMAFTLDYIMNVKRFAFVPEVGYYYRIDNISSATHANEVTPYEEQLHSFHHLVRSTNAFIGKHRLSEHHCLLRYSQRARQLQQTCLSLYYNKLDRKERLLRLKNDFSVAEIHLLQYAKGGIIRRILFSLLSLKMYRLFDICTCMLIYGIEKIRDYSNVS